jgi:hypothetical protein
MTGFPPTASISRSGAEALFYCLKKQLIHKNVLIGLACFLLTSDDEHRFSCVSGSCAGLLWWDISG